MKLFISTLLLMTMTASQNFHDFTMKSIEGKSAPLSKYKGKVILVVNTASECGLTPQYEELEAYYKEMKGKDFVILGFPANNFGGQEPGSDDEIKAFCSKNYGVSFPMFGKISVKGSDQHDLYQWLTQKESNGVADSEVQWNFQKYLIDKEGKLVRHFSPRASVLEDEIRNAVSVELSK